MKVYAPVRAGSVDGWRESPKELPGTQEIGPRYYDVEEWLTVVSGEITFFTLAGESFLVDVGRTQHIPCGEFLLSGAEDLVPILDATSVVEDDDTFAAGYVIRDTAPASRVCLCAPRGGHAATAMSKERQ
jgi:hypothetical protein